MTSPTTSTLLDEWTADCPGKYCRDCEHRRFLIEGDLAGQVRARVVGADQQDRVTLEEHNHFTGYCETCYDSYWSFDLYCGDKHIELEDYADEGDALNQLITWLDKVARYDGA